jgi:hypothetical protein
VDARSREPNEALQPRPNSPGYCNNCAGSGHCNSYACTQSFLCPGHFAFACSTCLHPRSEAQHAHSKPSLDLISGQTVYIYANTDPHFINQNRARSSMVKYPLLETRSPLVRQPRGAECGIAHRQGRMWEICVRFVARPFFWGGFVYGFLFAQGSAAPRYVPAVPGSHR